MHSKINITSDHDFYCGLYEFKNHSRKTDVGKYLVAFEIFHEGYITESHVIKGSL